jgi:hypothetical protein
MCHLSITQEGEGAGTMMSGPLVNGNSQTAAPFQFPNIVLDARVALLQLQPSSPTSTLVAFQFPNPIAFLFPPFSLMAAVCSMQLLPDDLVT